MEAEGIVSKSSTGKQLLIQIISFATIAWEIDMEIASRSAKSTTLKNSLSTSAPTAALLHHGFALEQLDTAILVTIRQEMRFLRFAIPRPVI